MTVSVNTTFTKSDKLSCKTVSRHSEQASSELISNERQSIYHVTTRISWLPLCRGSQVTRLLLPKVTHVMWPQHSSSSWGRGGWAVEGREEGEGEGEEAVPKSKRTEEEESLPLTGPMYIISEARMKGEGVREGKTGKKWKGRSEMGTKHQVARFRILKTLRGQEEIEKDKSREIQE